MNSQTKLNEGSLFSNSQKTGLEYVLKLEPDRLLSPCYTAVGLKPKAPTYGGWESQQIQGHSLGHYLSALSGFVYYTDNAEAKEKLDYTVNCLKQIQRNDGYVGGIPSTPFDNAFNLHGDFQVERFSLSNWWVPWYSVHKIYAGLIDAYTFGGNKDALNIVLKMADWAIEGSKDMSESEFQKMLTCEHGGMCKVYADLYGITGEEKYLKMAERFIHQEIYKPLAKQVDKLQGYHANTQIPKIIGLARLYELTGKEEYKTAAEFFFNIVTKNRSYVIGGNSKGEHFGLEFAEPLERDTCETCNTYNMLELAEHIFAWNKDASIADYYETALFNHILASQDPITGAKTYFVSMMSGFFKIYGTFEDAFWCCTGTGMENPERYNRFIFSEFDDAVYINLFIPATYTTKNGTKIKIETNFPYSEKVSVKIEEGGNGNTKLYVREPEWYNKDKSSYKKLTDNAGTNDTFEVSYPLELHTRRTRDRSGNFSILYGPIVLAAELGTKGMPSDIVNNQLVYMQSPAQKISAITADPLSPEKWITLKDKNSLTFETLESAAEKNVSYTLKPFYAIHHTRYATYFNASSDTEDERTKKYGEITTDLIEPGRQQSEVEHHFKNKDTEMGYIPEVDRNFRQIISKDGFISYRVKFDSKNKDKLILTFYGMDKGSLKVLFDSEELTDIELDGTKGNVLVDIEVKIPEKVIKEKGKNKNFVTLPVEFRSKGNALKLLEIRAVK